MAIYCQVNGVARPVMSVSCDWSLKQRATADVVLRDINLAYEVGVGQSVEIGDEDFVHFGGTIDEKSAIWEPMANGGLYRQWRIRCISFEQITSRRQTGERRIDTQPAGAIMRLLADECLTFENVDHSLVLDGPDVGPFDFHFESVEEAFDIVATAAGYYWDIIWSENLKKLRFFGRQDYTAPWNITATSAQVRAVSITAVTDRQRVANRIHVRVGQYIGEVISEIVYGDGSSSQFSLVNSVGSAPTIRRGSVDQTVGVDGFDTLRDWYWTLGSPVLKQDDAGTVLADGEELQVDYAPLESRVIADAAIDQTNIEARAAVEGSSGIYEAVIEANTITTRQDALAAAAAYLAANKDNAQVVTIVTHENDLGIGQVININLPGAGVNADFLIETMRLSQSVGTLPTFIAECSTGPLLPTWQQVIGGGGGNGAQLQSVSTTQSEEVVPAHY